MDITTLGLAVDSSQVTEAVAELDKLAASGVAAEASLGKVAAGAEGTKSLPPIFQATRNELDQLTTSGGKAEAALGRLAETSNTPVTSGYRESRSELQKLADSTKRAREAAEKLAATDGAPKASIAGYKATADALDHMAASGGKAGAALAAVGASGDGTRQLAAGAKTTAAEMDRLADAGVRVGSSLGKANTAGRTWAQQQSAMLASAKSTRAAVVELNAEQDRFISALQRQIETTGLSKDKLLAFKAAELGVGDQAKGMIAQLTAAEAAQKKHAASVVAGGAALNGFSLQSSRARREMGEIARGLARGDFQQAATSFTVFAQSSGLLRVALSPLGLVIGAVTAAVAGLAAAFVKGDAQSREFQRSIVLTGTYAGLTEHQFNELAESVSASTNSTIGSARQVTQELVRSGRFSGEALGATARAVELLARASGKSTDEVVKDFIGMTDGVAQWASKANESYHVFTAAQLEHIRTLEEQGEKQKAITELMDILSGKVKTAADNLGYLQRAWKFVGEEASAAIDKMLKIGRVKTPGDAIKDLKQQLADLDDPSKNVIVPGDKVRDAKRAALQEQLALAKKSEAAQQGVAQATAEQSKHEQTLHEWNKLKEASLDRQAKMYREIDKATNLGIAAGKSAREIQQVTDHIRENYKGPKGAKGFDSSREDQRAELQKEQADIRATQERRLSDNANTERLLEVQRSAGLVSEADYYEQKRALVESNLEVNQVALTRLIDLQQKEVASGKHATKDRLDNERKLNDLRTELDKKQEEAAVTGKVLRIQEATAINAVAQSLRDAKDAAESYLDTIKKGQERELEGFGAGQSERDRLGGRAQIEDKYDKQRRDLEKFRRDAELADKFYEGSKARQYYDNELALIRDYQAKSLASFDEYWKRRKDQEGNFYLGAQEALRNYSDEANNVYKQTERAVTNALQGMEDALVKFVTTGKLDFKSLADSIVADITRIIIKQQISNAIGLGGGAGSSGGGGGNMLTGLLGMVAGAFGGFSNSMATTMANNSGTGLDGLFRFTGNFAGRASGGPVEPGQLYEVNEKQPELLNVAGRQYLMMGDQRGSVTPNAGDAATAGATYLTVHVTPPVGGSRASAMQWGASAGREMQHAMRRQGVRA